MQKGFVPILIVLLIVVFLGIGGYFVYKNSHTKPSAPTPQPTIYSTPQPSPSPSTETANWKTYDDGTYSFRYPGDWNVQGGYDDYFKGDTVTIKNSKQTVVLSIYPKQPPYGFEGPQPRTISQDITVKIDGQNFVGREIIFVNTKAYADLKVPGIEKYHILFGTGYPAGSDTNASLPDYYAAKNTILQILSSLKFQKQ